MVLRYYKLASPSEEELSALERNIFRSLSTSPVYSDFAQSQNPGRVPEIEILYQSLEEAATEEEKPEKKRWFHRKSTPPKPKPPEPKIHTKEIVILTGINEVGSLDYYLSAQQTLQIQEAREVSQASVRFSLLSGHDTTIKSYNEMLKEYVNENYPKVRLKSRINRDVNWSYDGSHYSGDCCDGFLTGPIREVIELKSFLEKSGMNCVEATITFIKGKSPEEE